MSVVLKDGLVLPPGEKSEAEYRAKIARGEVRDLTFVNRLHVTDAAEMIEWAGGHWENGEFVPESPHKW